MGAAADCAGNESNDVIARLDQATQYPRDVSD
jgi:hypothetical protein